MRPAWKYYFEHVNGVIFVVDAADRERIGEVREEVHQLLGEFLS